MHAKSERTEPDHQSNDKKGRKKNNAKANRSRAQGARTDRSVLGVFDQSTNQTRTGTNTLRDEPHTAKRARN